MNYTKSRRRRMAGLLLAAAAYSPHYSHADATLGALSLEELLTVKVSSASKYEQAGSQAPSAVQVITRNEIQRHGWTTLTEALNVLPGLYVSNDKAYDFQGARGFQIPGDYNTKFLLLIDGQRNNDNIYDSALTGAEGWVDMDAVERIEYIPGPGSALYGSNAMFGVINVITRQGSAVKKDELSVHASQDGRLGVSASTSRTLGDEDQGTRLFLHFSNEQKTGRDVTYADPLGQLVRADGSVSPDGVAHGLDTSTNQRLLLRLDHEELSVRLIHHNRTAHPSSAPYLSIFDAPAMEVFDGGTQINVAWDHALDSRSRVRARLGYTDFQYQGTYPYLDSVIGLYNNMDDVHGKTVDGELNYQWQTAAHRWIVGADFTRDVEARQQNFNSVPSALLGATDVDINTPKTRAGLYVQDEWRVQDDLSISLGVRADYFDEKMQSGSPRLGLVWQARPDMTVKLLGGHSYRLPTLYERDFSNGVAYLSNPALKPEGIQTTEGILEWRNSDNRRIQLSVYNNVLENLIQQVDTTGTGVLQYQNGATVQIHGFELGVDQQQRNGLLWRASLAVNKAQNSMVAFQENSPNWMAKASASQPFWGGTVILAGEMQLIGPRDYMWNATPYSLPMEVLTNLTATWPDFLAHGMQMRVRVSNLLDRPYDHSASPEMLMPSIPQPRRNVLATLTYVF